MAESLSVCWFDETGACGADCRAAKCEWEDTIPLTWEAFERARELGLNLTWLGVRLVDDAGRRGC